MSAHQILTVTQMLGCVVRVLPDVNKDVDFEPGMLAFLEEVILDEDETCGVRLNFSPFTKHNDAFLTRTYYDAQRLPVLTAKEAGCWKDQQTLWTDPEDVPKILQIVAKTPIDDIYLWNEYDWSKNYSIHPSLIARQREDYCGETLKKIIPFLEKITTEIPFETN